MQQKREIQENIDESEKDTSLNNSFKDLAIKDTSINQKQDITQQSQSSSKILTLKAYDQMGVVTEVNEGSNKKQSRKQIIEFEQNDQDFNQNIIFRFENFLLNHNQQINKKIDNSIERNQSSSDKLFSYQRKQNSTDDENILEEKYFTVDPLIQSKIQKYCNSDERDKSQIQVNMNLESQDMTKDFNITEDNRKLTQDQLLLQDTSEDINNFFDLQRFTIQSQNINNLTASTIQNENLESNKFCASNMNIFDDKQKINDIQNNQSKYSQILQQKLSKLQNQQNADQNMIQDQQNDQIQNIENDLVYQNQYEINTKREDRNIHSHDLLRETGESSEKRATAQFKSFAESQYDKDKIIESLNRREFNHLYMIPDSDERNFLNVNTNVESLENSCRFQNQLLLNTFKGKSSPQTSGKGPSQSNMKLRQFLQGLNESSQKNPNEINLMYQAPISLKNPSYSSSSSNIQSNNSKQNQLYSQDSQKFTEIENIDINIIPCNQNSRNRDQNSKQNQQIRSEKKEIILDSLKSQSLSTVQFQNIGQSANNNQVRNQMKIEITSQNQIENNIANIINQSEYQNHSLNQKQTTQSTISLQTFVKSAINDDIQQLQKRIKDLENKINMEPSYFNQSINNIQNDQMQQSLIKNQILQQSQTYQINNEDNRHFNSYNQYQQAENIKVEDDFQYQNNNQKKQIIPSVYNNKLQAQRQDYQNSKNKQLNNIKIENRIYSKSISSESDQNVNQQFQQNQDQNFISINSENNYYDQKLAFDEIKELDLQEIEQDKIDKKVEHDQIQKMKKQFQNLMKKVQTSVRNNNELSSNPQQQKNSENYHSTSPKKVFQGSYESTQQAIQQKNKKKLKENAEGAIQESSDEKIRNTFTFQNRGRKQSNFANNDAIRIEGQNMELNQMQIMSNMDSKSSQNTLEASASLQFIPVASIKSLAFRMSEQNEQNIKSEMKVTELENTKENILRNFKIVNQLCIDRHAQLRNQSKNRLNAISQVSQNKTKGSSLQPKKTQNIGLKISTSNSSQKWTNLGKRRQSSIKQQEIKSTQKKSDDKFFSELKKLQQFKNQLKSNFILPDSEIKSQIKRDKQQMSREKSSQSLNLKQRQLGLKSQIIVQNISQIQDKKLSGRLNRLGRSRSQEKYLLNNNMSKPNTLTSTQFSTSRLISTGRALPTPISQSLINQKKNMNSKSLQARMISKQNVMKSSQIDKNDDEKNLKSIQILQNSNINSNDQQNQLFQVKNIPQSQTEKLSSRSIQKDLKVIEQTAHSVHIGIKNGSILQSQRNKKMNGVFKSLKSLKSQKSLESLPSLQSKSSIRSNNNFSQISGVQGFNFLRRNNQNKIQNKQSLISPIYQSNFNLQLQSNFQESKNEIQQRYKRGSGYRQKSSISKSSFRPGQKNMKIESQLNNKKKKRYGSKAIFKKQSKQKTEQSEKNNANDILIRKYLRQIQVLKNNQRSQSKQIETLIQEKNDQEKLIVMLEKLVHKFKDTFENDQKAKELLRLKNKEILLISDNQNEQIELLTIQNLKYEKKINKIEKKQLQGEKLRKEQDDLIKEMSMQISNVQIQIEKLGLQSILNLSSYGQKQSYISQICKQSVMDSLTDSKLQPNSKKKKDAGKKDILKKQIYVQSYEQIPEESMMSNDVSNQQITLSKSFKRGQKQPLIISNQFSSQESLNV